MYYSNLGTIYGTKGMMDEAEAQFKKALEVFPEDVLALFNLGRVHSDKRQFVEAKNYYERLVEVTQDDPMAWYNLAGVYAELDNPAVSDYNTIDMAIQCYLKVLELDPKHLECSFKLMEIALSHKKTDLAIKVMEEAVDHNPDEPLAYYNLISTYDKCKMFEQAEQTTAEVEGPVHETVARDGQSLRPIHRNSTQGAYHVWEHWIYRVDSDSVHRPDHLRRRQIAAAWRRDRQGDQGI